MILTEKRRVTILLSVSLLIIGGLMVTLFFYEKHSVNKKNIDEVKEVVKLPYQNTISNIKLQAKAAYVLDVETGTVLYAKNEEAQLPLASLTKLMTTIIASEYLKPSDSIVINNRDLKADGDSGLVSGETWNVRDLLSFTLIVSANDGALALARAAGAKTNSSKSRKNISKEIVTFKSDVSVTNFVNLMNKKAQEMNLTQTYFLNPTGLDSTDYISGGYGSARDVTTMLMYAIKHDPFVVEATSQRETGYQSAGDEKEHIAVNTNQIVDKIPGLIASKTGFTDLAGGNLVVAFDAGINHPVIIAVLGSTLEGRFSDVSTLVQATLKTLALQ